jgi:hypothetical protein
MTDDDYTISATCTMLMVTLALASVDPRSAGAATSAEVRHCRALDQKREQASCFRSLKLGRHSKLGPDDRAKTDEPTFAKLEGWAPVQASGGDASNATDALLSKTTSSAKLKQKSAHAKTSSTSQEGAPAVTAQAPPTKTEPATPDKSAATPPEASRRFRSRRRWQNPHLQWRWSKLGRKVRGYQHVRMNRTSRRQTILRRLVRSITWILLGGRSVRTKMGSWLC